MKVTKGYELSANGAFLAFSLRQSLTGYNNIDSSTGDPDSEIFLYSQASRRLVCASCNPSGNLRTPVTSRSQEGTEGGATFTDGSQGLGTPHYLTNSGQVFFDTQEALFRATPTARSMSTSMRTNS